MFSVAERRFLKVTLGWLFLSTGFITFAVFKDPEGRAVLGMGWGLILIWVVLGGALMVRFRDAVRQKVQALPGPWTVRFVLFATLLAMLEEVVTTAMTNAAPLFGVKVGEAYITASTNFWDVIFFHSVIVFVPMFVAWAVILSRIAFRPFAVFVLFGITGTLAESIYAGPQHLMEIGMWMYVYGLMVWLPAYCVPQDRRARPVRWWHYPVAAVLPFLFLPLVPIMAIPHFVDPKHPNIHFPPMKSR